jgi:hypothetical protein
MLSDERVGLSLMYRLRLLSSVRIAHVACYRKFFLVHCIQVLYQFRLCEADYAYLTYLLLQRQFNHFYGRKLDRRQVQASYIFCVWPRLAICREHVQSHGSAACTILLYNRIHTEG